MKELFTFKGTLTRGAFFKYWLLTNVGLVVSLLFISQLTSTGVLVGTCVGFLSLYVSLTTTTQRIRDTGLSGWHIITFMLLNIIISSIVPVLGLVFQLGVVFGIPNGTFIKEPKV